MVRDVWLAEDGGIALDQGREKGNTYSEHAKWQLCSDKSRTHHTYSTFFKYQQDLCLHCTEKTISK